MILHHRDGRVCQECRGSFPRCPDRPELPEALQKVVPEAVEEVVGEVVRRLAQRVAPGASPEVEETEHRFECFLEA